MLLTLAVIFVSKLAAGAAVFWVMWCLGERDNRRRSRERSQTPSSTAGTGEARWSPVQSAATVTRSASPGDPIRSGSAG